MSNWVLNLLVSIFILLFAKWQNRDIQIETVSQPEVEQEILFTPTVRPTETFISALETPTARPTETPLPAPTMEPTPTLPPPTLGVQIFLSDLPKGFVEVSQETLGFNATDISGMDFSNENLFLFTDSRAFHLVFGFSAQLNSDSDKENFQKIIEDPKVSMDAFADFYGAEILSYADERRTRKIADRQAVSGATLRLDENLFGNLDIFAFQRGDVGVCLYDLYSLNAKGGPLAAWAKTVVKRVGIDVNIAPKDSALIYSDDDRIAWVEPSAWILDAYENDSFEPIKFEPATLEAVKISEEAWGSSGIEYDTLFAYTDVDKNSSQDINIIGYSRFLPTYEDVGLDATAKDDLPSLFEKISAMIGATNLREYGVVSLGNYRDFETVRTLSAIADIGKKEYELSMVAFRRNNVSTVLFMSRLKPEQKNHAVFIADVAQKLDNLLVHTERMREEHPFKRLWTDDEIDQIFMPEMDSNAFNHESTPIDIGFFLPEFHEVPDNLLDFETANLSGQEFYNYDPFVFIGLDDHAVEGIYGFSVLLETKADEEKFAKIMEAPDVALLSFVDFYGGEITAQKPTDKIYYEVDKVAQIGATLNVGEYKKSQVEMVAFRKGDIGLYLLYEYPRSKDGSLFPSFPDALAKYFPEDSTSPLPAQPEGSVGNAEKTPLSNPYIEWLDVVGHYTYFTTIPSPFFRASSNEPLIRKLYRLIWD